MTPMMLGSPLSSLSGHGWCCGLLILDKPSGMTCRRAVTQLLTALGIHPKTKWGFVGTLDPLATGLLPIALGSGTKAIPTVESHLADKTYQATWVMGQSRLGDDATGVAVGDGSSVASLRRLRRLEQALPEWGGMLSYLRVQRPPDFSAKHVHGKRAYQLARKGQAVVIPPSTLQVKSARLIHSVLRPELHQLHSRWEVTLSRGGYVRSLARDLGIDAGLGGHLLDIRRIQMGGVNEAHLLWERGSLNAAFIPFTQLFAQLPYPLLKRMEMSCRICPIQLRENSHHPASWQGADDQECHYERVTRAERSSV